MYDVGCAPLDMCRRVPDVAIGGGGTSTAQHRAGAQPNMYRKMRIAVASACVTSLILAAPRESHAIFHWLRNLCCGETSVAPAYAAAAYSPMNPCNPTPVVANYVPQICYRTQYVSVPVSTYQPVTACNPCTGLPVTTMRPAINYMRQPQLVPYTAYRVVYSSPLVAGGTQTVNYAPTSGCSNCGTASATSTTSYGTPLPGATASSQTPVQGASAGVIDRRRESSTTAESQEPATRQPLAPIPDPEVEKATNSESSTPRLISPHDRTMLLPLRAARTRAASSATPPEPPRAGRSSGSRSPSAGQWRPSNR